MLDNQAATNALLTMRGCKKQLQADVDDLDRGIGSLIGIPQGAPSHSPTTPMQTAQPLLAGISPPQLPGHSLGNPSALTPQRLAFPMEVCSLYICLKLIHLPRP